MSESPARNGLDRRSFIRKTAVGAGILVAAPTLWKRPASAAPIEGIHLTYGDDPARSMVVSWSSAESVANPSVEFGVDESYGTVVPAASTSAPDVDTVYHEAVIDGLEPDTTYTYRVGTAGERSDPLTLTTSGSDRPVRFTAFGDQGTDPGKVAPVVETIRSFGGEFHFHVGDLSYASSTGGLMALELVNAVDDSLYHPGEWDTWLAGMSPAFSTIPLMTVVGNHEMEPYGDELGYDAYLARFRVPAGGAPGPVQTTWTQTYGNVAVVALDGNDASYEIDRNFDYLGGAQETWLRDTLAAHRADPTVDWIVVGFHHCVYCSSVRHGSDGGVRDRWAPLFDEFNVDVVMNGHNHLYERTHPVRAGEPTTELAIGGTADPVAHGTVYVTSGLAVEGEPIPDTSTGEVASFYTAAAPGPDSVLRIPELTPWSAVVEELSPVVVGFETSTADEGTRQLTVTGVDASTGAEVDRFTLVRAASTQPATPADLTPAPAPPPAPATPVAAEGRLPATGGGGDLALPLILAGGAAAAAARRWPTGDDAEPEGT